MDFSISKESLLKSLQLVIGAVEKRITLPILSHVLIQVDRDVCITATDMEVELKSFVDADAIEHPGQATLPARKLLDICRSLPDGANIQIRYEAGRAEVLSGKTRYQLASLPAQEFPHMELSTPSNIEFSLNIKDLTKILAKIHFAMAQQDVRFYLNGVMFTLESNQLVGVAANGHRLALNSIPLVSPISVGNKFILPRKGVQELTHLLPEIVDETVVIHLSSHFFKVSTSAFEFVSKLIDSPFPDYQKVLPPRGDKIIVEDRDALKAAFSRASILSTDKHCGISLELKPGQLLLQANNPDHEVVEEEIAIDYQGQSLAIAFNVRYLIDVLQTLPAGPVQWTFNDATSGIVIESLQDPDSLYVVMPMRL